MAKKDYYASLGISKNATADDIKKAHRKLVRKYHPDVNKNNKAAEEKFKEVQEAYDILSDPTKRQNYDQFGDPNGDPFAGFRGQGAPGGGAGPRQQQWRAGPNVTVEDFDFGSANGGFADIFEQMFGGAGRTGGAGGMGGMGPRPGARTGPRGPIQTPRGQDIEHTVSLSFEHAARGTHLPLTIDRDGQRETIDIKIPPGVKDGSRIRIKGRGQHAPGAEPGDLYILTHVHPHPYFRREDLDIYIDVPISLYEALLGTKVDVPTLDGPLTVTIPPGTSSHAKLRLKGKGIERGDQKGDQYAVIKITLPKDLTPNEKEIIRQIAEKHPLTPRADWP